MVPFAARNAWVDYAFHLSNATTFCTRRGVIVWVLNLVRRLLRMSCCRLLLPLAAHRLLPCLTSSFHLLLNNVDCVPPTSGVTHFLSILLPRRTCSVNRTTGLGLRAGISVSRARLWLVLLLLRSIRSVRRR